MMGMGRTFFLLFFASYCLWVPFVIAAQPTERITVNDATTPLLSCDQAAGHIPSNLVVHDLTHQFNPSEILANEHLFTPAEKLADDLAKEESGTQRISPDQARANHEAAKAELERPPVPSETPAPLRLSLFAQDKLVEQGYIIEDAAFAAGGQGVLALVVKGGKRFLIKEVRQGVGDRNGALQLLSVEAFHAGTASVRAAKERQPEYFIVPRVVDLTPDEAHPVLEIPFFPRSPGSDKAAPSLQARIDKDFEGLETLEIRMKVFQDLINAFAIAHRAKVIHRDPKPENVLLNDNGELKVIDFGIAANPRGYPAGKMENSVTGTPQYMSENAIMGEPAHRSDDIEPMRKIGWVMVNGRAPTEGKTFNRPFFTIKPGITDYKNAPEGPGIPDATAVAVWSRLPRTMVEYGRIIQEARTLPEKEFFESYGKFLKQVELNDFNFEQKQDTASYDILGSKRLIAEFPEGLGMGDDKGKILRDRIILGAFRLRKGTSDEKDHLIGPHRHLYYDAFFSRLTELQAQGLAESNSYYEAQLIHPPTEGPPDKQSGEALPSLSRGSATEVFPQ